VSFDGFRWDYLDMVRKAGRQMPVFQSLIDNGVKAKWVKNSYVTLTFPNHYTIATGLYEQNHGIISNKMYDPVFRETFDGTPEQLMETKWWNNGSNSWTGEPIWLTNQNKLHHYSGVYFWTGSEAAIDGRHAEHYKHYNWSVPYTRRIDTVMSWFSQRHHPINFGMLYFEDPDSTGHRAGPVSLEMIERLVELDEILGYIINSAKERGLFADMNLIVTSDHGMASLTHTIYLDDYVDSKLKYAAYGRPPVLHLLPKDGNVLILFIDGSM
jgi:ectonucleotide pyrophosphatase/phosphodiesterase family protein 5